MSAAPRRREARRAAGRGPAGPAAADRPAARKRASAGESLGRLVRARPWKLALALVLLHLLLAWAVFDPTVFTGGDNAAYLSLARSLLERHAYLSLWEPLAPPQTQYPPVFPGMLALGLLLGLRPWVGTKLIVVACSAAAVALSYLWLRRRRRPVLALAVGAIVAFSPGVLAQGDLTLSDVPFWAFAMLGLWAFERLGSRERLRFALAVAAVVLGYFTRSAGLPLVLAAFAWLAWRRRWRQLAGLAAVIVPLAFLWWLRGHLQGGSNYVALFWYVDPYRPALGTIGPGDLLHRMLDNARSYLGTHLPVLLGERVATLLVALSIGMAVLALYGWIVRMRRPQVAELFFPLYVGLIFVWPAVWAGERFLLPAFPLLLAYAGDGASHLLRRVYRPIVGPLAAAIVALLALVAAPALRVDAQAASLCRAAYAAGQPRACLPDVWQDFFDLATWARQGLPPGAAVFSRKPTLFFAYSSHPSHDIPTTQDPREFLAEAQRLHVDYVLVDRLGGLTLEYFGPILAAHPDAFCLVRASLDRSTALLKLVPSAPVLLAGPPQVAGATVALQPCAGD